MLLLDAEGQCATTDLDSIDRAETASPPSAAGSRIAGHAEPRRRPRHSQWTDDEQFVLAHRIGTAQCVNPTVIASASIVPYHNCSIARSRQENL